MKDAVIADKKGKGVLVREGGSYRFLDKSRFERKSLRYYVELTERLLEEEGKNYVSLIMDVCPSLSAKPEIYLDAIKNILGDSYIELTDSKESLFLGESSCSCGGGKYITTGAIGFSGKYNDEEVKGRIGAKWMVSHDMVRVDMECGTEQNKEFFSAVRNALIMVKPQERKESDSPTSDLTGVEVPKSWIKQDGTLNTIEMQSDIKKELIGAAHEKITRQRYKTIHLSALSD